MASPNMLAQRERDMEREAEVAGYARSQARLRRLRRGQIESLIAAANAGDEGAKKLVDAMRAEMVGRYKG